MKFLDKFSYYKYLYYDSFYIYASRENGTIDVLKNDTVVANIKVPFGIQKFSNGILLLNYQDEIGLYDFKTKSYTLRLDSYIGDDFSSIFVHDNCFFICSREDKNLFSKVLSISFWEHYKLKWIQRFSNHVIYKAGPIILLNEHEKLSVNINTFSRLDYHTGNKLWTFKLSDHESKLKSQYPFDNPLMIKKTLGEYNGNIWFALNNGCVMAIDSDTGAFKHWIRDIDGNDEPWANGSGYYSILPEADKAVMDTNKGQLVFFLRWYYWVLDLTTLQVDFHNLKSYFEEEGYNPKSLIQLEGNSILSTDHSTRQFASFNRATLKFDWIEKVPDDVGLPTSIEKVNDKYYVKTNSTELLIYQNDKVNEKEV